ncbi:PRD domain-containing protein [Oceanobacillus jeddahense]|uniref:PRD domain-containing protein n=1 Tax=Oceanobacillus jeddahense TaxID=1462527 RepID=A0ABY5JW79_9BACI|nr:PRD domain-containing protein [Oceanobacillus jeddahense]UUI03672.1 PRD domain-containing protein [Oceanobacillus jeddahense]
MKINRVLNNNSIVIKDKGVEKILIGSGIAFQKGKNDIVDPNKIEKIFVLEKENEKFKELLSTLPEEHIMLSEEVISYAENTLGIQLSNHIHISLTDHLSFAIERMEKGIIMKNKLLNEIRLLYKQEFEIGLWAIDLVQKRIGIHFPIDEAAYLAIHIHTAKMKSSSGHEKIAEKAQIVQNMITIISSELNMEIDKGSISYQRLVTHLDFLISRKGSQQLDGEMFEMIKRKYDKAFHCAEKAASFVELEHNINFSESDLAYVALHLQRLINENS